jgi:hypothetical protein
MKKIFIFVLFMTANPAWASQPPAGSIALKKDDLHTASTRKMDYYVHDGVIVGGNSAVEDVVLLDVRHSIRKEYERIVLDVEGNKKGDPTELSTNPSFHVAVTPDMNRIVLTVGGNPKLALDAAKVKQAFKKSKVIRAVEINPVIEKDRWTMVLHLSQVRPVEVFELGSPGRIILDLRGMP